MILRYLFRNLCSVSTFKLEAMPHNGSRNVFFFHFVLGIITSCHALRNI